MEKPRIIIADADIAYAALLQIKFAEELFDKVELEIITDRKYYEDLFLVPQKAKVLIISDEFYNGNLAKHNNIEHIFLMSENSEEQQTTNLDIIQIYKYTNVNVIFNQITGASTLNTRVNYADNTDKSQIIMTFSATGGVGRTTVAMSIAACLTRQFRKVLYIGAEYLQTFQYMLENQMPIMTIDTYAKLSGQGKNAYPVLRESVRKEMFCYIPPFKAPLISVGLDYSIYEALADSAKKTGEYDFIIVDAEPSFQETNVNLLDHADRVLYILNQTVQSVEATNRLINSINCVAGDKNIFICNKFRSEAPNAIVTNNKELKYRVDEYVTYMEQADYRKLSETEAIKKISMYLLA